MNINEICQKYYLDSDKFEAYVRKNHLPHIDGFYGMDINDKYVEDYVNAFWEANDREEEERKLDAEEDAVRRKATSQMLITSGFNFDGYHVVKYSGYISGDDAVYINRGFDSWKKSDYDVKDEIMRSLTIIRRNALQELKDAAYELGCNAVIGVDFDYLNLDPQTVNSTGGITYEPYIFGVTANGNAVVIEKDD